MGRVPAMAVNLRFNHQVSENTRTRYSSRTALVRRNDVLNESNASCCAAERNDKVTAGFTGANSHSRETSLSDRGIDNALRTVLLNQALRDFVGSGNSSKAIPM